MPSGCPENLGVKREDLQEKLRLYLADEQISISELARRLKRDNSYVHRVLYEKKQSAFSFDTADHICMTLGLEMPQVYRREWVAV